MNFSVIITTYKEPESIKTALSAVVEPNKGFFSKAELIIIAPDDETLAAAENEIKKLKLNENNYRIIKDEGKGKPAALNLAIKQAKGKIIFLTDGDMYISENAISEILPLFNTEEVGGVSGHPISLDGRGSMFGYYSQLFCEGAHQKRLIDENTPMSGYLYAIRNLPALFPLPEEIRAEDAYLSKKIQSLGYKTVYAPEALAYVHFPKNFKDWINQKKRSLGGNIQLKYYNTGQALVKIPHHKQTGLSNRSMLQDLEMVFFPLTFAKTPKEFFFSLALYPMRLYLWLIIYYNHLMKKYASGMWQRIESSKR